MDASHSATLLACVVKLLFFCRPRARKEMKWEKGEGRRCSSLSFFKLEIAKTRKRTFQGRKKRKTKNAITPWWVLLYDPLS